MKEFMMIFLGGEYETAELSPEEFQNKMELWNKWITDLRKDEIFLDGKALKNTTKHIVSADQVMTDGAFVETKELVTGYFVVKANNLEEVKEMTKNYPDYDLGGRVEIREVQTF